MYFNNIINKEVHNESFLKNGLELLAPEAGFVLLNDKGSCVVLIIVTGVVVTFNIAKAVELEVEDEEVEVLLVVGDVVVVGMLFVVGFVGSTGLRKKKRVKLANSKTFNLREGAQNIG